MNWESWGNQLTSSWIWNRQIISQNEFCSWHSLIKRTASGLIEFYFPWRRHHILLLGGINNFTAEVKTLWRECKAACSSSNESVATTGTAWSAKATTKMKTKQKKTLNDASLGAMQRINALWPSRWPGTATHRPAFEFSHFHFEIWCARPSAGGPCGHSGYGSYRLGHLMKVDIAHHCTIQRIAIVAMIAWLQRILYMSAGRNLRHEVWDTRSAIIVDANLCIKEDEWCLKMDVIMWNDVNVPGSDAFTSHLSLCKEDDFVVRVLEELLSRRPREEFGQIRLVEIPRADLRHVKWCLP